MFIRNKTKNKKLGFFPADSISIVAASMRISGDIDAEYDMRIDGTIEGNVYCKARVVVGPTGRIEGDLHAHNADIFGTVNGNISTLQLLCLKSKCVINGNITVGSVDIEADAEFNGSCTMAHEKVVIPQKAASLQEQY